MRCSCCNKRLSDYETTLKHGVTGEYLDTCLDCLSDIAHDVPMPVKARRDLLELTSSAGKDLIPDMDIHDDVDELTDVEYNRYSKGDNED